MLSCAKNSNSTSRTAVFAKPSVTMDFFEQRYYRLLTFLLKTSGQWPLQSNLHSWSVFIFSFIISVSVIIPQVTVVMKYHDNLDIILESAIGLIFVAIFWVKMISLKWKKQKVFSLLNHIQSDWSVWKQNREINTLCDYTEQGRKIVLAWVVAYISMPVFVVTQPVILKITDILVRNGSNPGAFPIPLDYHYFDEQKYYFYIIAHILVFLYLTLLMVLPFGSMFIVSVHHGCGIFAALSNVLKEIGKNTGSAKNGDFECALNKRDMNSEYVAWCIRRHHDAIEFAQLIESTFSWYFLLTSGLNVLLISVSGYQIVKSTASTKETLKFAVALLGSLVNIYVESYVSQILMDHSNRIRKCIQHSEWYKLTPKVQKLLYVMLIRCNVPCKLTAGKMSVMCLETFAEILKTSMSCLTVLRSM